MVVGRQGKDARRSIAHRFLVIDDDAGNARMMARLAASLGEVVVAEDCAKALAAFGRYPRWTAAVVDHFLPGGTGTELIEVFRKRDPELTAVLITGTFERDLAAEAQRVGAEFVAKLDVHAYLDGCLRRAVDTDYERCVRAMLRDAVGRWALSPRQVAVVECGLRGLCVSETAAELQVSRGAVRSHWNAVLDKACVDDGAEVLSQLWSRQG